MYSPEFLNYDISSTLDDISNTNEIFEQQYIQEKELVTSSFEIDRNSLASSDSSESSISTFDLLFNNNKEEDIKIYNYNKRCFFSIENFGRKKRGRPATNNTKRKPHTKNTEDNVITKIKTHYMKFIINFINDCINSKNKKKLFKHFNHKDKSSPTRMHIKELQDSSISDLLMNIQFSTKYKKNKKNAEFNRKLVEKLSKDNTFFTRLFKMEYLELFDYYYNGNKPTKKIVIDDQTIKLSESTTTFFDLIQKNKVDKEHKERILEVAEKIFKIKKV